MAPHRTTHLDSVHVNVRDDPVLTLHLLSMYSKREVLRHHAVHVDNLHACALKRLCERLELLISVQIRAVQQAARPRKDRRDGVRRRLTALLVFAVVARDGAVRGLALDRPAVRRDELRGHHAEGAEALR